MDAVKFIKGLRRMCNVQDNDENCMIPASITKAPQSWCYVEEM